MFELIPYTKRVIGGYLIVANIHVLLTLVFKNLPETAW